MKHKDYEDSNIILIKFRIRVRWDHWLWRYLPFSSKRLDNNSGFHGSQELLQNYLDPDVKVFYTFQWKNMQSKVSAKCKFPRKFPNTGNT